MTTQDPADRAQRVPLARCRDGSAVFYSGHTTGDHGTEEWEVVTLVRVTPDRRVDFRSPRSASLELPLCGQEKLDEILFPA